MTFGQRVTLTRKERNLTQTELGDFIETSGNTVSKYERDSIVPSIDVAAKIAKALNISLDYLVGGISPAAGNGDFPAELRQYEHLNPEDKAHVNAVIEAFVTKAKIQTLLK